MRTTLIKKTTEKDNVVRAQIEMLTVLTMEIYDCVSRRLFVFFFWCFRHKSSTTRCYNVHRIQKALRKFSITTAAGETYTIFFIFSTAIDRSIKCARGEEFNAIKAEIVIGRNTQTGDVLPRSSIRKFANVNKSLYS